MKVPSKEDALFLIVVMLSIVLMGTIINTMVLFFTLNYSLFLTIQHFVMQFLIVFMFSVALILLFDVAIKKNKYHQ